MNLIVTSICNKDCSFCFAKDKNIDKGLSIQEIKSLVEKASPETHIKILGGEPTLHKDFPEIMDYLLTIPNPIVLISNFLIYKDSILDAINKYQEKKKLMFLLNVSEVTDYQFQTVIKNIKYLAKTPTFSLGYTLDINRKFNDYSKWLDKFYNEIGEHVNVIRVSVPFPNYRDNDERDFYLYHNYEYTDLITEFVKWSNKHDLKTSIDCGLFPCMFRDQESKEFIQKFVNFEMGCKGGAFDIFSTKLISLCYPGNDIIANLENHNTIETAFSEIELRKRHKILTSKNLPKECKECEFFLKECAGPCLGFIK
ncbi:MAG: radical SAM protein [bacterium]